MIVFVSRSIFCIFYTGAYNYLSLEFQTSIILFCRSSNNTNYKIIIIIIIFLGNPYQLSINDVFRWQYVNPAFERLLGYKGDEIFGKNSSDLTQSDYTKPDVINSIHSHLRAGQVTSSMRFVRVTVNAIALIPSVNAQFVSTLCILVAI